jgi:KaiC/GvpD/RAD55 family RecA-like ATPase
MEVAGLVIGAVGVTALYSTCLEVLEAYDEYKSFDTEGKYLADLFETDKFLLRRWASGIGIALPEPGQNEVDTNASEENWDSRIQDEELLSIVKIIFLDIINIFGDIEASLEKMHIHYRPADQTARPEPRKTREVPRASGKLQRTRWALSSKASLTEKLRQFESFLNRLYKLSPLRRGGSREDLLSETGDDDDTLLEETQKASVKTADLTDSMIKKDINDWLGPGRNEEILHEKSRERLAGTCDWILATIQLQTWLGDDDSKEREKFLWINGGPGTGKSVLSARIISHLAEELQIPTVYSFAASSTDAHNDPFDILRSWIAQLANMGRECMDIVQDVWESAASHTASITEVVPLFPLVISAVPTCAFVIDGLDEFWASEDDKRQEFLHYLHDVLWDKPSRLLFVSQDRVDIRYGMYFDDGDHRAAVLEYTVKSQDVQPDIELYSRALVDKKLRNKDPTRRAALAAKLAEKSDGMFLWVKLQESSLRGGKNMIHLEKIVSQTPKKIQEIYCRNWSRILASEARDCRRAIAILRWATFSLRPLTVAELAVGLAIPDDDSAQELDQEELPDLIDEDFIGAEIVDITQGFIEVRSTEQVDRYDQRSLHLVHYSIKEFLTTEAFPKYLTASVSPSVETLDSDIMARELTEKEQKNLLAITCLHYLNMHNIWTSYVSPAFLDYAMEFWFRHSTKEATSYERTVRLTNQLLDPRGFVWGSWIQRHLDPSEQLETASTPLYHAATMGLTDTVRFLLEDAKVDPNVLDGLYGSALGAACYHNQVETARILLEHGATDVNSLARESPLELANKSAEYFIIDLMAGYRSLKPAAVDRGRGLIFAALSGETAALTAIIETEKHKNHGRDGIVSRTRLVAALCFADGVCRLQPSWAFRCNAHQSGGTSQSPSHF